MRTVHEILLESAAELASVSETARLDAELLLAFAKGEKRGVLLTHPERVCSEDMYHRYRALVDRRKQHEPIAYLVGEKEFYGLALEVNSAVLIPRPETELLVERALEVARDFPDPVRILDLGTGSGAIVIAVVRSLLDRQRSVEAIGVDCSADALAVARRNARRHGINTIAFLEGSWFSPLRGTHSTFDIIMTNPPYVPVGEVLAEEVKCEPAHALRGGADGLDPLRRIVADIEPYLATRGVFLSEIGSEQGAAARELIEQVPIWRGNGSERVTIHQDLAGLDRLIEVSPRSP